MLAILQMALNLAVILSSCLLASSLAIQICASNSTWFCHNDGQVLHAGLPVQGLFFNSRMIQGVWTDLNSTTVPMWSYPNGAPYDPHRQAVEFVGNMSSYAACGLDGFTVGLQGGGPTNSFPPDQPWISTAFNSSGGLDAEWMGRLGMVLDGARAAGLTPIVNLFYQGQIERLADDTAVVAAVDGVVDWLVAGGYTAQGAVMMDVANEVGLFPAAYASLQKDTIYMLVQRAKQRSNGSLLVSSSVVGAAVPPDSLIAAADFVLIHCNGETPQETIAQVNAVRASAAWIAQPKPIVFNECGTNYTVFSAAIGAGAGWGNYDQGENNYVDGFQSPPTNWEVTASANKRAFFGMVANYTGQQSSCAV